MKRHIVHLHIQHDELEKKESKKNAETVTKALLDAAEKGFKMDMDALAKAGDVLILNTPCTTQTFTRAFYVDLNDKDKETLQRCREAVRHSAHVEVFEVDYGTESVGTSKEKKTKKDLNRFMK